MHAFSKTQHFKERRSGHIGFAAQVLRKLANRQS